MGSFFRRSLDNPTSWTVIGREHEAGKPSASPVKSRKITETANAMIGEQPEAPVLLSLNKIFANEPTRPQIGFDYENTSSKITTSVGVKYEIQREKDSLNGLVYEAPINHILKPGQWMGASFNPPVGENPYKGIVLTVAFVKFEDGSVWNAEGFDSTHACEGYRAGQEAARSQFAELVQKESSESVIKAAKVTEINVPAGHSVDWANGYRMGARQIMFSVLRASMKKDATSIPEELKKPSTCPLQ